MTEHLTARLSKWPFVLGDIMLLGLAGMVVYRSDWPLSMGAATFCLVATALGAWFCVLPFLKEYHAASKLAESNALSTALAQIKNLEQVQAEITRATGQWMGVRDDSTKTVAVAAQLSEKITSEANAFREFLQRANESEKAHLRLEVEKLRRSEADWLQVLVRILDHIYALNQAGARSGQPALTSQLNQFQHACRDAARKVGLAPIPANRYDTYDAKLHQLANPDEPLPPKAQVMTVHAVGYTFQGTPIRKPVVSVSPQPQAEFQLSETDVDDMEEPALETDPE